MNDKLKSINILILAFAANLYLVITLSPDLFHPNIFEDSGTMSIANILLLLTVWIVCLWNYLSIPNEGFRWFCWLYIVQIYYLREADFHRAFTSINVTKPLFYQTENIPVTEKLIAGLIMAVFSVLLIHIIITNAKSCINALLARKPWAISFLCWFCFLFLSQVFDKSALNYHPNWKIRSIEEMLEFTAAMYALAAITLYSIDKAIAGKQKPAAQVQKN
jgi:hypothetical protein